MTALENDRFRLVLKLTNYIPAANSSWAAWTSTHSNASCLVNCLISVRPRCSPSGIGQRRVKLIDSSYHLRRVSFRERLPAYWYKSTWSNRLRCIVITLGIHNVDPCIFFYIKHTVPRINVERLFVLFINCDSIKRGSVQIITKRNGTIIIEWAIRNLNNVEVPVGIIFTEPSSLPSLYYTVDHFALQGTMICNSTELSTRFFFINIHIDIQ